MMSLDAQTFKQVMAQWPSGVAVVTSMLDGERVGITASSLSSVSLEPPLVLVCAAKRLHTHDVMVQSGIFAVNILRTDQVEMGKVFAGLYKEVQDRFAGIDTVTQITGAPILSDALAWLDCRIRNAYDGGDHTIFVGEVLAGGTSDTFNRPLVYHNRSWGQFSRQLPAEVTLCEVGLRDGLQNEEPVISTDRKVALIHDLAAAGLKRLQVTSFVHPERVPSMADAELLCAQLDRSLDVIYSALVLNMTGLQRAHAVGMTHVDVSLSASDTHSRKNANMSQAEAREEVSAMIAYARQVGMVVRGEIQCAFGCVYEGSIPQERVLDLSRFMLSLGIDELSLADSTGMANPLQIRAMLAVLLPLTGALAVSLHLHDTRGLGLANVMAALEAGVTRFDTALGGLGGCPFIEGASGNIATEDTVYLLHEMGIPTRIDLPKVAEVSRQMEMLLGKSLPGKLYHLLNVEEKVVAP